VIGVLGGVCGRIDDIDEGVFTIVCSKEDKKEGDAQTSFRLHGFKLPCIPI
jgi:hypothetical protein